MLELFGVDAGKDRPKRIVRGNAIGKVEKLARQSHSALPNSSTSTQPSASQMTAQM